MSAFLKIDRCATCQREACWEWVPPVALHGKTLAGTGVWRSALLDGCCDGCRHRQVQEAETLDREQAIHRRLVTLFGGEYPVRRFTFDHFEVAPGNQDAFERAKSFDARTHNLYLWGSTGVGKTHLSFAAAAMQARAGATAVVMTVAQLIRKVRMRPPDVEQETIRSAVDAGVLLLDELDIHGTPYSRQILQEILDHRYFRDCGGLLITSPLSPTAIARRAPDSAPLASRLVGMCRVLELRGPDHRIVRRAPTLAPIAATKSITVRTNLFKTVQNDRTATD